jgi:hypothetical protein
LLGEAELKKIVQAQSEFKSCRLSEVILINPENTEVFAHPPENKKEECLAQGVYLSGVKNNLSDGSGARFNWVLNNGHKSEQRDDDWPTDFTHLMPE